MRCDTETLRAVLAFAPDARYQARGQDDEGWSLIRRAIDCRDVALVEALLDAGADPDPLGPVRERPLVRAVAHGSRDMVEVLLARGARPSGTAAVEAAIAANRRDLYDLLVRAGAPAAPGRPVASEAARKPGAAAPGLYPTSSSPFDDEPDAARER